MRPAPSPGRVEGLAGTPTLETAARREAVDKLALDERVRPRLRQAGLAYQAEKRALELGLRPRCRAVDLGERRLQRPQAAAATPADIEGVELPAVEKLAPLGGFDSVAKLLGTRACGVVEESAMDT